MRRWLFLLVIASAVVVADQGTKLWAVANLTKVYERAGAETATEKLAAFYGKRKLERIRTPAVQVHPDYFQFRYVENPGAAWGMLGGLHDSVRIPFFYGVSIVAIGIITAFFVRIRREQVLLRTIFAAILGGAIGNFIDRAARGYVIDFIDWHWRHEAHWPTFNVADVAISLGLAGLVIEGIFGRRPLVDAIGGGDGAASGGGDGEAPPAESDDSALPLEPESREHASAAIGAGDAPCTPISSPGSSRQPS